MLVLRKLFRTSEARRRPYKEAALKWGKEESVNHKVSSKWILISDTNKPVLCLFFASVQEVSSAAWVIIDGLYSHFIFHWTCNWVRISLSDVLLAFPGSSARPPSPPIAVKPTAERCFGLESMHIATPKTAERECVERADDVWRSGKGAVTTNSVTSAIFECTYVGQPRLPATASLMGLLSRREQSWWPGWFSYLSWTSNVLVPACPGEFIACAFALRIYQLAAQIKGCFVLPTIYCTLTRTNLSNQPVLLVFVYPARFLRLRLQK